MLLFGGAGCICSITGEGISCKGSYRSPQTRAGMQTICEITDIEFSFCLDSHHVKYQIYKTQYWCTLSSSILHACISSRILCRFPLEKLVEQHKISFFPPKGNSHVNGDVCFQVCKQTCLFAVESLHIAGVVQQP